MQWFIPCEVTLRLDVISPALVVQKLDGHLVGKGVADPEPVLEIGHGGNRPQRHGLLRHTITVADDIQAITATGQGQRHKRSKRYPARPGRTVQHGGSHGPL